MEEHCCRDVVGHLAEAATIQDQLADQRLTLEWTQILFARLLRTWMQLETHENLAYEDKVASQVQLLDEATGSLRHLNETLVRFTRLLRRHRQHLCQTKDPLGL
jgi:hypothetical protein